MRAFIFLGLNILSCTISLSYNSFIIFCFESVFFLYKTLMSDLYLTFFVNLMFSPHGVCNIFLDLLFFSKIWMIYFAEIFFIFAV